MTPAATIASDEAIAGVCRDWPADRAAGFAVAIVEPDGSVLWRASGYADLACRVPIDADTPFNLRCLSKQFFGMGVAMLEDAGDLDLGDPVRMYLPELHPCCDPITVGHLLYHTSGLRDLVTLVWLAGRAGAPEHDVFRLLTRQTRLVSVPGARFMYSRSGYFLLSRIIERVTSIGLHRWFDDTMFTPAGMTSTSLAADDVGPANQACGYRVHNGLDVAVPARAQYADAAVFSTAGDLARWDRYLSAMAGGSRQQLIERACRRGRLSTGAALPYAYGVSAHECGGTPVVFHSAQGSGLSHMHIRLPAVRRSVVMLSNAADAEAPRRALQLLDVIHGSSIASDLGRAIDTTRRIEKQWRPANRAVDLPADCYGSYYSHECDATYEVVASADGVSLRWGREVTPLARTANGDFEGRRVRLAFARDERRQPYLKLRAWGVGEICCSQRDESPLPISIAS